MTPVEKPAATSRRMTRAVSFSFSGLRMRLRSRCWRASASSLVAAVTSFEGFCNQIGADSLLLQILAYAAHAELLIFLAQASVGFRKGDVVEVAMLLEAGDDGGDGGCTTGAWLSARGHEAAQLNFSAHVAAEGLDGVGVESGLGEGGARLGGFAVKGHDG